jgi:hypothetical protein
MMITQPSQVVWPSDEVLAMVSVAPVPLIPLAELSGMVVPFEDAGVLVDWLLTMPTTPGSNALKTYWDWSRTWASFRGIGSLGNIVNLLGRFGDGNMPPASKLVRLLYRIASTAEDVVISALEGDLIAVEIDALASKLAAATETGFGLIDDMPSRSRTRGVARTWAPPRGEVALTGTESTVVVLREGVGLVVLHGASRREEFEGLRSVDLRREPALLVDLNGRELTLSPADARPLAWLLPRSLVWHVESISLTDVWEPLLTGLPAAISAARESGRPVRLTTRSRVIG